MSIQTQVKHFYRLIVVVCLTLFGQVAHSFSHDHVQVQTRDRFGFTECFILGQKTYVLEWDRLVNVQNRIVRVYDLADYIQSTHHYIKNCKDVKYIKFVPSEILKSLDCIKNQISHQMRFEIEQIMMGAHTVRTERSALEYIQNRKSRFSQNQPEVLSQLRYEVGDRFAQEVMSLFIDKIIMNDNRQQTRTCANFIGTCDFYLCQEAMNPCGIDGYNLRFGYKYCSLSLFKLLNKMSTESGRKWVGETFSCLQIKNMEYSNLLGGDNKNTCQKIENHSFDDHPNCYARAGFCELKLRDKLAIFSTVKAEIFSKETLPQGYQLLKNCLKD